MNRYRATHSGVTYTRNSKIRTYTHCVLRAGSLTRDRESAISLARNDWKINRKFHQEYADGTSRFLAVKSWEDPERKAAENAKQIEKSRQWLARGCDGLVADAIARCDARTPPDSLQPDGDTYYYLKGWCGSLELARKQASRPGDVIVEAVEVTR